MKFLTFVTIMEESEIPVFKQIIFHNCQVFNLDIDGRNQAYSY